MKTKYLFFIVALGLAACSEQVVEETGNPAGQPISKAIVNPESSSVSNPELLTNWENLETVVLNTAASTPVKATLPWKNGAILAISVETAQDIKKEDGWIMLFHTFKEVGTDVGMNYMCFYNRLTGLLKVFYFLEGEPALNSNFIWRLNANGNTVFFNLEDMKAKPSNQVTHNSTYLYNLGINDSRGISSGWNAFEMELPYSTDYTNLQFIIDGYCKNITEYTFMGKTQSTIEGTIIKTVRQEDKTMNAVAQLSGNGAKKAVDNLLTNDKVKVGSTIKDAVLSISTQGYVGAIKTGLKLVFGSIFGKKKSLPEIQKVKLTSNGTITMKGEGSSTSTAPIKNFSFTGDLLGNRIGVWTLESEPVIEYSRYTPYMAHDGFAFEEDWDNSMKPPKNAKKGDRFYFNRISLVLPMLWVTPLAIKVNPDLQPYITDMKVETQMIKEADSTKRVSGFFSSKVPQSYYPLIYQDEKYGRYLLNSETWSNYDYIVSGDVVYQYFMYYDWGTIPGNENILLNVMVEITYNYEGKEHTFISARNYDARLRASSDKEPSGPSVVIVR